MKKICLKAQLRVWLSLIFWLFALRADAAVIPLQIIFEVQPDAKLAESIRQSESPEVEFDLAKVIPILCEKFGKNFTKSGGPWGMGPFTNYSCEEAGRGSYHEGKESFWSFRLTEGKDYSLALRLEFFDATQGSVTVFPEVLVPASRFNFIFLNDDYFADLLTVSVLDALNFPMPVTADAITKGKISGRNFKGRHAGLKTPAPTLIPYSSVELVAQDSPISVKAAKKNTVALGTLGALPKAPKRSVPPTWALQSQGARTSATGVLAGFKDGPGSLKAMSLKAITAVHDSLLKELSDGKIDFLYKDESQIAEEASEVATETKSGYFGLRFGHQILAGDPPINETNLVGLFFESRGDFIKGLRVNYDTVPLTAVDDASVQWSRLTLGRAFIWKFDQPWLRSFSLTPKLGVWSFALHTDILVKTNDSQDTESISFEATNKPLGAIEVAFGLGKRRWLFRPSYTYELSLQRQTEAFRSSRFGLDTFWRLGGKFSFLGAGMQLDLIGFYIYESMTIQRSDSADLGEGRYGVSSVGYSTGYLGGGAGLVW